MAAPASRSLELDLPAVPDSAPQARRAVARMLEGLDHDAWTVDLVVSEAVTNAVLHAYRHEEPGRVRVEASLDGESLTIVVADDGVGMSPHPGVGGLGVGLRVIAHLAERLEIQSTAGTRLLIRLRLGQRP